MFSKKCHRCGEKNCQAEQHCSMCGRTEEVHLARNIDYPFPPTLNLPMPQETCWACMTSFTGHSYGFMCAECDGYRHQEHECHHVLRKLNDALQQMMTAVNTRNASLYPMSQILLTTNHSLEEVNMELGIYLDAYHLDATLDIITFYDGDEQWEGLNYAQGEDIGDLLLDLPSNRYYYEKYALPAKIELLERALVEKGIWIPAHYLSFGGNINKSLESVKDERRDFTHFDEAEVQFYNIGQYPSWNAVQVIDFDSRFWDGGTEGRNHDRPVVVVQWPAFNDEEGKVTFTISPSDKWGGWSSPLGTFRAEDEAETAKSSFETAFDAAELAVTALFKEYGWWGNHDSYDVSTLHNDDAGWKRLGELQSHLSLLMRPGGLLWSSGDVEAFDAYPEDLQTPTHVFEQSGIYIDEDGETDGYTDEEREGTIYLVDQVKSPDLDIRLRYAYELNRLDQFGEQYFDRLDALQRVLESQFDSNEVTIYRALALGDEARPQRRKQTVFPLSMRMSHGQRYWENREMREKYTYETYGEHWSLVPGFEWSYEFPSQYGKPVVIEKRIPYTDVDWYTTLLIMAYGREPEFEVAVNENVFLAENEVKITLYHVTPLDQVPTILENGLEAREGLRSKQIELEPRVWLFGDLDSVDQAIMNWFGDEMVGDEWRSGYAVLQVDLPATWFQDRRVEKTFDPYGSERSWEWSTRESISSEYLEVVDKWEWNESQLVEFQVEPSIMESETIEPHLYLDMDGCFADFAGKMTQRS